MLRIGVAVTALVLMLGTAIAALLGAPLFLPGLVWPLVVLLGLLFERWRYSSQARAIPASFHATGERFNDPEIGKLIEVYFDPSSGERRYVEAMASN